MRQRSALFIEALDVDEVIAHLLVAEGFTTLEEVAYVTLEDLMEIEGFDEDIADELLRRAQDFLEQQAARLESERIALGVSDALAEMEGLTGHIVAALGRAGVLTLDDFADLSSDELRFIASPAHEGRDLDAIAALDQEALEAGLSESAIDPDTADAMIMAARAHWFDDEPEPVSGDAPADDRP